MLLVLSPGLGLLAQVLPLDSVLSKIEKSNPGLKMYNAKINALNEYANGATNWDAPIVGGGLWMTPYTNPGMGSFMLSIEQMIPNSQRLNAKKDYMSSLSSEQKENSSFVKNQLFYLAKRHYYRWVVLKKKLVILEEAQPVVEMMIKSAELNYSNSEGKLNSIYKAKARFASLVGVIVMTKNEMQQKAVLLNTLMNRDRNLLFDIDTNLSIKNYENAIVDSSFLLSNRSDLRFIDRSLDIVTYKQKMELAKRKPSFGVRYNNMTPFNTSKPSQFNIMGMMTIPIAGWSAREYRANVKGLDFEKDELKFKKQNLLNESAGKLGIIILALKNSKEQINIYEQSILPALRNNLSTSQLAYGQNRENLFVVLDAWEAVNNARMEYLNKLEELLYLQIEYEKELEQK